jgi:hypothetical protein
MVLKLELKRCADLVLLTSVGRKKQLLFPFTDNLLDEPFPTPARQRKWIKELLVTWYQEINQKCQYSAIMIEITSGAYQPGSVVLKGFI